jgi:hypothetical protein
MRNIAKRSVAAVPVAVVAVLLFATVAFAATYSLFGDAEIVSPGNNSPHAVQLRSDDDPGFGGIDFDVPAETTFADLDSLATDYKFIEGSCGGGAPRFQVNVEDPISGDTGNIFVYIGPPPNYTGCPQNVWQSTGDLLEGVNPIDTTQLDLGTFYDPYTAALLKYGSYIVTGVQLVTDGGWAVGGVQTVHVDNVNIDGTVYTFDQPISKDDCKNGGWQTLTREDGTKFKNQGDCIQYVNTGK